MFRTIALTLGLVLGCVVQAQAANDRPNIVFAFADDWGRYAGAYADLEPGGISDLVQTPNFDRVAREGVLFRRAFVSAPSCTPCRSSILTGRHFFRTGTAAILQGAVWNAELPSYPLLLEQAGYHIGYTAKVWGPGTPSNSPFTPSRHGFHKHGNKFNRFSQFVSGAEDAEIAKQSLLDEVRGNFQDFLNAGDKDRPFCYWWGPTNCHRTWVQGSGKELWDIDPDGLQGRVPPFLPDVEIVRQDIADYLGEVQAFDAGLGVLIDELERTGQLKNTMIVVSGDHGIPGFTNGKCNLYDFGTAVPLAIRWGAGIPVPGRVVDDFISLPDLAPTFLDAAGLPAPDGMDGRSVLSLLSSAESGHIDPSRDHVIIGRERHVARARLENLPYPQRALRTGDYLYIQNFKPERWPMGVAPGYGLPEGRWPSYDDLVGNTFAAFGDYDASPTKAWIATHYRTGEQLEFFEFAFGRRPGEELYHLPTDPDQIHNLADDPNFDADRRRLADQLMSQLRDAGDPRVIGDGSTFDQLPYTVEPAARRKR